MNRTFPGSPVVVLYLAAFLFGAQAAFCQFTHYVTRQGDKLFDGDRELRFISLNIPNLHYLEDYLPFSGTNPWRFPDEFEIRDALTTIKQLGGKATRMYVLSVRRGDDPPGTVRHVDGPGGFNEEAFRALDKVLQVANEVGIRVMIPFVDNWHWWGGPREYAGFRGMEKDSFWTNPQIVQDFKATVRFLVTRRNTYTGTLYRDDKAILAWETGNELQPPYSWTREIAAFIKGLDSNHLLAEGIMAKDISQEALDDTNIDILTTHHYGDPAVSLEKIVANQSLARGRKPYIIGEYGIVPPQDIRAITDTIINQGLAGGMIWSLRYRNREGGFYHHYEYNNVAAYRWPGFSNGSIYDEKLVLNTLREKAYQIDGLPTPRMPLPGPPRLLEIQDPAAISWQGSTGAQFYTLERRESSDSAWRVVAERVDESAYQYRPQYADETSEAGREYFYRLTAKNESGTSAYSSVVGPVMVTTKTVVDEMEDYAHVFQKDGRMSLLTFEDIRKAKEDRSRLTGEDGSYLVYKLTPGTTSLTVEFFAPRAESDVFIETSEDLEEFDEPDLRKEVSVFGKNDYGFFDAVTYLAGVTPGKKYARITLRGGCQVSRVTIRSGS